MRFGTTCSKVLGTLTAGLACLGSETAALAETLKDGPPPGPSYTSSYFFVVFLTSLALMLVLRAAGRSTDIKRKTE